jgi:hypothetical protein
LKDFIEIHENSLDEIVYNAMILFRHSDLGAKIDTSLNREIKKDGETPPEDAPLQLRLRLHNRFNMDLNNVYAIEIIPEDDGLVIETSVNVYHDDFNLDDFTDLVLDLIKEVQIKMNIEVLIKRFAYNFRNTMLHWKAAKEKQFIIDPQVDRLKQMHDVFNEFSESVKTQSDECLTCPANDFLEVNPDIVLEKRKFTYAKSKILKIVSRCSPKRTAELKEKPQFFSLLLLEYCLIPLFMSNELYVMSLIYKRDLEDIRSVLKRRIQEV